MRTPFFSLFFGYLLTLAGAHAAPLTNMLDDIQKIKTEGKSTFLLDIDNDSLLLKKDDGFYTSGLRLTQRMTLRDATQLKTFGWRVGQALYTASDIKLPPQRVGPPDHPYAGWLYGGLFTETYRADGSRQRFGIDIGCLGPCAGGKWTQTNLHRLLNQPLPQGWDAQVKNEAGALLYADIAPVRWTPVSFVDITPGIAGRFGNIFTDASASVVVRAGQLNALPDEDTFHTFLRLEGRGVGYNATLQGGYFSNGNTHVVNPKRMVGEAEAGLLWQHAPYGISASIVRRSNEIRDLPNSIGAQNFARLQFSYTP
jgi:lipid A 3-O-deacylase